MKKIILTVVLLLFGCGDTDPHDIDISMTTIVWEGYVNESEDLLQRYNDVKDCLNNLGYTEPPQPTIISFPQPAPYPYVIAVAGLFICANVETTGCYDWHNHRIYFYNGMHKSFRHEAIHHITGSRDENSKYLKCAFCPCC